MAYPDVYDSVTGSVITRGFFTIKDEFIQHSTTTDNDFFLIILETTETITPEITVLY
jgi:hypothetical protein